MSETTEKLSKKDLEAERLAAAKKAAFKAARRSRRASARHAVKKLGHRPNKNLTKCKKVSCAVCKESGTYDLKEQAAA